MRRQSSSNATCDMLKKHYPRQTSRQLLELATRVWNSLFEAGCACPRSVGSGYCYVSFYFHFNNKDSTRLVRAIITKNHFTLGLRTNCFENENEAVFDIKNIDYGYVAQLINGCLSHKSLTIGGTIGRPT